MNVSNCIDCGKLHRQAADTRCSDCMKRHIEDVQTVKAFLQENPRANVMEVVKHTGFPLKKINELAGR